MGGTQRDDQQVCTQLAPGRKALDDRVGIVIDLDVVKAPQGRAQLVLQSAFVPEQLGLDPVCLGGDLLGRPRLVPQCGQGAEQGHRRTARARPRSPAARPSAP